MMHCPENDCPIIRLDETDSSSNYLHKLSQTDLLKEFTIVRADYQTSGKGQRGNSWESANGENLLFSMLFYPGFLDIKKQFMLSKAIAISIKETLDNYADGFTVKWPNDIYWQDKKISGTLLESDIQGGRIIKSIAGIGININQDVFYSEAPNPVSLTHITQRKEDMEFILKSIADRVRANYNRLKAGEEDEINKLYHAALYRREGLYRYRDDKGEFSAYIVEVIPEGLLVLQDNEGGIRKYAFKEVQYVI